MEIDKEVRRIVDESLGRARKLLADRREDVRRIAEALLDYEVLSAEDVDILLKGDKLSRKPARERSESGSGAGTR